MKSDAYYYTLIIIIFLRGTSSNSLKKMFIRRKILTVCKTLLYFYCIFYLIKTVTAEKEPLDEGDLNTNPTTVS